MANFEDALSALKSNAGSKNSRSPLNDPFYAESLIIQSKSIVGRMYSSNEYVRFKYECELNQLVKEYRVWLAEIKREEREIGVKLDAMRQEQREISKERHDLKTIQLVAKTNREFISYYKRRGMNKRNDRSVHQVPQTTDSSFFGHEKKRLLQVPQKTDFGKENKLQKVLRLPKIVSKLDGVVQATKKRRTSLPAISSPNMKTGETQLAKRGVCAKYSGTAKQSEHNTLVRHDNSPKTETKNEFESCTSYPNNSTKLEVEKTSLIKTFPSVKPARNVAVRSDNGNEHEQAKVVESNDELKPSDLPLCTLREPRILSAPKSRSEKRDVLVTANRPSSACGTTL
jgi:hypothetical protein